MINVHYAAKTHRELFSDFYADLMREPLEKTLAENPRPFWSVALFGQMMRDLSQCNGQTDPVAQVCLFSFSITIKFCGLSGHSAKLAEYWDIP